MSNKAVEEKEKVIIEAFRNGNTLDKARIMRPAMKVYDKLHPGYLEAEQKKYINPAEETTDEMEAERLEAETVADDTTIKEVANYGQ